MILRRFNKAGIEEFRKCLNECRNDPEMDITPWQDLLEDDRLTVIVDKKIEVEPRSFQYKKEAADYFNQKFESMSFETLNRDYGLWAWLSLFYFDSICPLDNNIRIVRSDYCYIVDISRSQSCHHLLYLAWYIFQVSRKFNKMWENLTIATRNVCAETVFGSLYLTRIDNIFEVIEKLYWDPTRNRQRPYIVNPKQEMRKGDLRNRFPTCIRQLEMTYDIQCLSADKIIELLGEEFFPENIGKK